MKLKMNTEFTQGDIQISYFPTHDLVHCTIPRIAFIKINEDGIVEGSADSVTIKSVELRDYLKSLFELDELFMVAKSQHEIRILQKENNKLKRLLSRAKESK